MRYLESVQFPTSVSIIRVVPRRASISHLSANLLYRGQGEKKSLQILLSYSQAGPGRKVSRAGKKYLATTYKDFFSALYTCASLAAGRHASHAT